MKLIRLILIVFLLPISAKADFGISHWNEYIQLTDDGKKVMLTIQGQVKGLEKNQMMTAFSLGFSPKQKITITSVALDGKDAKYDFKENKLKVNFPDSRSNNQLATIKIAYEEKYELINRYLRQEAIYVPDFAAGAASTIMINFSGYELTTYLLSGTHDGGGVREGSRLTYTTIVPKEGILKSVKFTPDSGAWKVVVKTKIIAEKELGEFVLKAPSYFYSARQRVSNYQSSFSKKPSVTDRKGGDISYTFRIPQNEFEMRVEANVFNGAANQRQLMKNMISYSKISQEEMALVASLLNQAKTDPKYAGMPIYVAIGEFVHDYLRYDKSYVGALLPLADIIKNKVGVCVEFAKLYDVMARAAGIPSLILDGGACGEYDECQGHSWNMIFYGGRWIEVDPTWNLMSGAVSSSHVYISDGGAGEIAIKYRHNAGKVQMNMDLEMQDLNRKEESKVERNAEPKDQSPQLKIRSTK